MSWKWYGVKTAFRTSASGRPASVDADFDSDATLVEERIVLVRARTPNEAIAKGEAEANKYVTETYRNAYGQTVLSRYLGAIDAFELFDDPAAGEEVFSSTEIISSKLSDKDVIERYFGKAEPRSTFSRRKKFLNCDLPKLRE